MGRENKAMIYRIRSYRVDDYLRCIQRIIGKFSAGGPSRNFVSTCVCNAHAIVCVCAVDSKGKGKGVGFIVWNQVETYLPTREILVVFF